MSDIDQALVALGIGPADRSRILSAIAPTSYPSDHALTDWRKCGRVPGDAMSCNGPSFVATKTATTVYARLTYWDGQKTGIIKLPVK